MEQWQGDSAYDLVSNSSGCAESRRALAADVSMAARRLAMETRFLRSDLDGLRGQVCLRSPAEGVEGRSLDGEGALGAPTWRDDEADEIDGCANRVEVVDTLRAVEADRAQSVEDKDIELKRHQLHSVARLSTFQADLALCYREWPASSRTGPSSAVSAALPSPTCALAPISLR